MTASILNGKALATTRKQELIKTLHKLYQDKQIKLSLAVILIGHHVASSLYVKHKQQACQEVGIISKFFHFEETISEKELLHLISQLNEDVHIDGILVQLPLPMHINTFKVIEAIDPLKDVDGFHPFHLGKLAQNHPIITPCTPQGILHILDHYEIALKGLNATIIGASNIVGRPLALALLNRGCTITICHSHTRNLEYHVQNADILISATGKYNLVSTTWFKQDLIIIDVGISRHQNKVRGDIDFDEASKRVKWITPVPGGVGPMTVFSLLENTLILSKLRRHFE